MFKHFFVVLVLGAFFCFLYGIGHIFLEVEDNACRMTYMFGFPQFSRVRFAGNEPFPKYGLYYYYEGQVQKDVNALHLNGAPVIFVPGNSGSHKQVRSLASVALQKAMNNDREIHLDYFTVDYNEELSGLYGGYLANQKAFLKLCIRQVLRRYSDWEQSPRKVVLIGHSMGGKVAQSVLSDNDEIAEHINTIICISTPLDRPVFNIDAEMDIFYRTTNEFFRRHLEPLAYETEKQPQLSNGSSQVHDVMFVSLGGGNRDLLVRAALTTSRYSDIHAMVGI